MPENPTILEHAFNVRLDMLLDANTYTMVPLPKPDWYEWQPFAFEPLPPLWYSDPQNNTPPWYPQGAGLPPEMPLWFSYFTAKNLVYPPTHPPLDVYPPPLPPPLAPPTLYDKTFFEELCCIGFNPDTSECEAIIRVKKCYAYGGYRPINVSPVPTSTCDYGSFESVGFWLQIVDENCIAQGDFVFLGEKSVRVYDIRREADCEVLHYSVKLALPPTQVQRIHEIVACSDSRKIALLHAVLGWNQTISAANFGSANVPWGNDLTVPVQLVKSNRFGQWKTLQNNSEVQATHAILMRNGKVLYYPGEDMRVFDYRNNIITRTNNNMLDIPRPMLSFWVPDATTSALNTLMTINTTQHLPEFRRDLDDFRTVFGETTNPPYNAAPYTTPPYYTQRLYQHNRNYFCSGHTVLGNGQILVVGGHDIVPTDGAHGDAGHQLGIKSVALFDPASGVWQNLSPTLRHGRWYPSVLPLGDGTVFIMSGHPDDAEILLNKDDFDLQTRVNTPNSPGRVREGSGTPL